MIFTLYRNTLNFYIIFPALQTLSFVRYFPCTGDFDLSEKVSGIGDFAFERKILCTRILPGTRDFDFERSNCLYWDAMGAKKRCLWLISFEMSREFFAMPNRSVMIFLNLLRFGLTVPTRSFEGMLASLNNFYSPQKPAENIFRRLFVNVCFNTFTVPRPKILTLIGASRQQSTKLLFNSGDFGHKILLPKKIRGKIATR